MSEALTRLLGIMARLRGPEGCPWDRKQTYKSIAHSCVEEAYETVEAIESGDAEAMREELGDLLLQIVFHAQMAAEEGLFDFDAIADGLSEKLIHRHPHVFGGKEGVNTPADVKDLWEAGKAAKREEKAASSGNGPAGVLDDISTALPATSRALKLCERAARVGFDWPLAGDMIAKIREETDEVEAEIVSGKSRDAMEEELGDLMFVTVNLARQLKIDPETALRKANRKFVRRFKDVESRLAALGRSPAESNLDEMERLWGEIKKTEKNMKQRENPC